MTNDIIALIKHSYPKGTRIVLDFMDDPQSPPVGSVLTVEFVDDAGTIHGHWSSGCGLGLIYGEDRYHILKD